MSDEIEITIDAAEDAYLQGDFKKAIGLAKQVVRSDAANTSALHILGCAAFAAGDRKSAKATLRKLALLCRRAIAAAADEEERQFYSEILGTIGDDLVEQDEGGAKAARFLLDEVEVETLVALQTSVADGRQRGKWKDVLPRLERLCVLKPHDAGVQYQLASGFARLNRKKPMLTALERAIALDRACVRALGDPTFKRFHSDPAMQALCQPLAADPHVRELYCKLEDAEWEEVVATGELLLAQPTDALAVLEAMNDALENLVHSGANEFLPQRKRINAQLVLLKQAGARSTVYEEFLMRSLKT